MPKRTRARPAGVLGGRKHQPPLSESRMQGKPHVRFDERDLETEPSGYRARSRLYHFQATYASSSAKCSNSIGADFWRSIATSDSQKPNCRQRARRTCVTMHDNSGRFLRLSPTDFRTLGPERRPSSISRGGQRGGEHTAARTQKKCTAPR